MSRSRSGDRTIVGGDPRRAWGPGCAPRGDYGEAQGGRRPPPERQAYQSGARQESTYGRGRCPYPRRGGDYESSRGGAYQHGGRDPGGRGGYGGRGAAGGAGGYRGGGGGGGRGGPAPTSQIFGDITVCSNQFGVVTSGKSIVYQNLVEIEDMKDPTRIPKYEEKEEVLAEFLKKHNVRHAELLPYDGDKILLSQEPLHFPRQELEVKKRPYSVEVTHSGAQYDLSKKPTPDGTRAQDEVAQILDILLQWASRVGNEKMSRGRFVPLAPSPKDYIDLRPKGVPATCLLLGHSQKLHVACSATLPASLTDFSSGNPFQKAQDAKLYVAVNASCAPFLQEQPLNQYICEVFNTSLLDNPPPPNAERISADLKNFKIETFYIPDPVSKQPSKRTYKIECMDFSKTARNHMFEHDGRNINLVDYFRARYNIKLKYPSAPLIQVKPKRKGTYLPLELVNLSKQKVRGIFDDRLKRSMAEAMVMAPGDRKRYILSKAQEIFTDNPVLQKFAINVAQELNMCKATVIQPPLVRYRNTVDQPNAGAWNLMRKKFITPKDVRSYAILDCSRRVGPVDKEHFEHALADSARTLGMNFGGPAIFIRANVSELAQCATTLKQKYSTLDDAVDYAAVKNAFCEKLTTACVVYDKSPGLNPNTRGNPAGHYGNILSKINVKLQGSNHTAEAENAQKNPLQVLNGKDGSFMVLAVTTVQPMVPNTAEFKFLPTVCAAVASLDPDCLTYAHSMRVQPRGNVLIQDLGSMVEDLLVRRNSDPSKWPRRILYYREGVTETQMHAVRDVEITAIRKCYADRNARLPDIQAIVIHRSQPIRFFDPTSSNPRQNLGPGTVIKESAIHPGEFANFFLISHAGIKGTSRSPRYFIIGNDLGQKGKLVLDFWVHLCYTFCFTYAACQRAVSVPCPMFYATKLAQRAAIHVKQVLDSRAISAATAMSSAPSSAGSSTQMKKEASSSDVKPSKEAVAGGGVGSATSGFLGRAPSISPEQEVALASAYSKANSQLRRFTQSLLNMFYI